MSHSPATEASPRSRQRAAAGKGKQKQGLLAEHGGTIVLLSLFFLFGGYMLDVAGIKSALDRLFSNMNQTAHTHDQAVASTFITVLPFVILVMGVALVMILFGGRGGGKRRKKGASEEVGGELTLHAFAELARVQEVSPKVARAAYRIFQPRFNDRMRTLLEANLRTDLGLDEDALETLTGELERRTDRKDVRVSDCITVLDLLRAVESRPDAQVLDELRRQPSATGVDVDKGRVLTPLPRRAEPSMGRVPVVHAPLMVHTTVAESRDLDEQEARPAAALFVRPARPTPVQPAIHTLQASL